jgi:hypothetical protein
VGIRGRIRMGWVKKQGDSMEMISSTSFFVLMWFGEAILGGPGLTSGALVRGG